MPERVNDNEGETLRGSKKLSVTVWTNMALSVVILMTWQGIVIFEGPNTKAQPSTNRHNPLLITVCRENRERWCEHASPRWEYQKIKRLF